MLPRVSQQLSYVLVSYDVPVGTHVFKWKFTKDFSISYGDDAAFVRMIQVTGTAFADTACTACSAGTYTNKVGSSSCTLCPAGTSSPTPGARECEPCRANEYSFPGADRCYPSAPCTQSDVVSYYSGCFANLTRAQYYYYQTPKICSENLAGAYRKPADRYDLQCAPCPPGTIRNLVDGQCDSCPTNTFSPGGGAACRSCDPGHAARRDFIWNNFDELPPSSIPATMECVGNECGTNGWRLGPGYIDSGVGHGAYSTSSFSLSMTTESASAISFNISFHCSRLCYVTFTDTNVTDPERPVIATTRTLYSFFVTSGIVTPYTIPTSAGSHNFTWSFSKFDSAAESRGDLVRLHYLRARSVVSSQGGAPECQACSAGEFATSDKAYCQKTPPGHYSAALATKPEPCPANTFAEKSGMISCLPCGRGTTSTPGSSWCAEDCKYRLNDDISYDLKPLSRDGGDMYGPVTDPVTRRSFFLNVCSKSHSDSSCVDDDGIPLPTPACMIDIWGFGIDMGRVTNMYPHPSKPEQGLTIVYANSTTDDVALCRVAGITTPRTTNITFNCDSLAGFGAPSFVSSDGCTHLFSWDTLFACPACDDSDWDYYYSECVNGKQQKTYKWKDNPRKCHSGMPLPAPEERACSVETQTPCPAGTYLLDECTDCPAGTWSWGGAKIFNHWPHGSQLNGEYFTLQPSGTHHLKMEDDYVEISFPASDPTDEVSLSMTFNTVYSGENVGPEVHIVLASIAERGYTASITLDEMSTMPLGFHPTPWHWSSPRLSGMHTIRITLKKSQYTQASSVGWIRIYKVVAFGTSRAATVCTDALPGTYVADPSKEPSKCPLNTFQPLARQTSCDHVPAGKWAPPGSKKYFDAVPCKTSDYEMSPSGNCGADGKMEITLRPRPGNTCTGNAVPTKLSVPCGCKPGSYKDSNGACKTCPNGQSWDPTTRLCQSPVPGRASYGTWSLLEGRTELPPQSPPVLKNGATDAQRLKYERAVELLRAGKLQSENEIADFLTLGKDDLDSVKIGLEKKKEVNDIDENGNERDAMDADAPWYTSCGGSCSRGWTFSFDAERGPIFESGLQIGPAVSSLTMTVPMAPTGGALLIAYTRTAGNNVPFLVLVDGVVQHSSDSNSGTQEVEIVLSGAANHKISFVAVTKNGVTANSVVKLWRLTVVGASIGGKTVLNCPAGYFSSGGESVCVPCSPGTFAANPRSTTCQKCPAGTAAAYAASTSCESCPTQTSVASETNGDHDLCAPMCSIKTEDGKLYDWNDLAPAMTRLTRENLLANFPELYVYPCAGKGGYLLCRSSLGSMTDRSFICGDNPWLSKSPSFARSFEYIGDALKTQMRSDMIAGRAGEGKRADPTGELDHEQLNFGTVLQRATLGKNGIVLEYKGGSTCPSGEPRTTTLNLICPSSSAKSEASPTYVSYSECHAELQWVTTAACKACTKEDYREVVGKCESRKQSIIYVLNSDKCHHSTFTTPASSQRPCSSVNISIGFVIAGVLVLALLLASVAVFCLRHKKLSTEYRLLKAAHDGTFADNETQFGVDDDEEGVTLDNIGRDDEDDDGLRLPTAQSSDSPHEDL